MNTLTEKIEVWGFSEGITLFQDSSLGFGFRLCAADISCATDEKINLVRSQLRSFLGSLPSGIDLQFVQTIEKDSENGIKAHVSGGTNASELVQSLAAARGEKFSILAETGNLPLRENLLFVRVPPPKKNRKHFIRLFANSSEEIKQNSRIALEHAKSLRAEIGRNLGAAGFPSLPLSPEETGKMVFDTWNPNHPLGMGGFEEEDIRDRSIVSELVKDVKGFRLAGTHHRVVTLKILPEQTYAGMADALTNLPFASKLLLSIHVPDQNKEIEWLKLNRRMAYAMVIGKKGVSDMESEAKLRDIEELLSEVVKDGEKIFMLSLAIVLRSESEEDLDSQVSHVLQVIRELSGSEGFMETYAAFDIFSASSIPNARNKERSKRLKSSNVADLLPVFGLWCGFEKPAMLLRNRSGSLFHFDPFTPTLTNANQIISGGSGSGKSYLTNLMVGQMLSQNPKVFILDVGGSYQKTCELLGGQYIPLSLSSGISMNPFDRGTEVVTSEKIKFLTALVQIMAKEDDRKALGKLEKAEIERAIQEVYTNVTSPNLTHLREKLLASDIEEVKRVGKILSLWTGDSPFGKFLDRETTISLDKRIVCFDLKGLEATPDLQAAALFTITDLVWREVQKDRAEMKFLVFDECWRLLESDAGSQFVGEVFRTFRKYYASAIAISQNIDDFANSRAASAILPNASIKWILKQPGANFKRLAEVLRLNEREVALVQSLSQVKGEYSEAFLQCEDRRGVVSVESTPLEYWLATTDPRDHALLASEQKSGRTGLSLLEHLAAKYPTGATPRTS